MTRDEKYKLLLNLTYRKYLLDKVDSPVKPGTISRLFWQELAFDKDDLMEWVKKNGLPKKEKAQNLRLGLGLDYYYDKDHWVVDFYERGGPIGSTSTKDPLKVVELLISDEFPRKTSANFPET